MELKRGEIFVYRLCRLLEMEAERIKLNVPELPEAFGVAERLRFFSSCGGRGGAEASSSLGGDRDDSSGMLAPDLVFCSGSGVTDSGRRGGVEEGSSSDWG